MKRKRKLVKSTQKPVPKPPPIIVVPDKTYIDDAGNVIRRDVILISDPAMYERMEAVVAAWGKEKMGVPGQRGKVKG